MRRWRSRLRALLRVLAALFFVFAGVSHFTREADYLAIVPPWLPWPRLAVAVSGVAEIAGGLGLLHPRTRRLAAAGLVLLLVAVFPANLHMALERIYVLEMPREPWILWARLPLQLVFVAWVWWSALARDPIDRASA